MTEIVSNIIQNSLSGFVVGAVTTVGGFAGDAVTGVGNYIEGKGNAIGTEGIAKSFDGLGRTVTSYGNACRIATAPNTVTNKTAVKKSDSGSKQSIVRQKKVLPSGAKSLPAPKEPKLLTSSPPRNGKGTFEKSVAPFKQGIGGNQSTYAPSTAVSTVTNKTSQTARLYAKSASTPIRGAGANRPAAKPPVGPIKSATNAAGKVIIDPKSRPGNKTRTASPKPNGTYQPKGGYQGPINLGGIGAPTNAKSRAGSAAGGGSKPKVGAYEVPLHLGRLA